MLHSHVSLCLWTVFTVLAGSVLANRQDTTTVFCTTQLCTEKLHHVETISKTTTVVEAAHKVTITKISTKTARPTTRTIKDTTCSIKVVTKTLTKTTSVLTEITTATSTITEPPTTSTLTLAIEYTSAPDVIATPATVTVPTRNGFVSSIVSLFSNHCYVLNMYQLWPSTLALDNDKRAEPTGQPLRRDLVEEARNLVARNHPPQYPQAVTCLKVIIQHPTNTFHATKTVTVTPTSTTKVHITSTIIKTTTIYNHVQSTTTISSTITTNVPNKLTSTVGITFTSTTTNTIFAPAPTFYAECGPQNAVSGSNFYSRYLNPVVAPSKDSAYDCCFYCRLATFFPSGSNCQAYVFDTRGDSPVCTRYIGGGCRSTNVMGTFNAGNDVTLGGSFCGTIQETRPSEK